MILLLLFLILVLLGSCARHDAIERERYLIDRHRRIHQAMEAQDRRR